jgi:hypothetical protein
LVNGEGTGRLHDSFATLLAGVDLAAGGNRYRFMGGVTKIFGWPSLDGEPMRRFDGEDVPRYSATLGFDALLRGSRRVDTILSAHLTPVPRREPARRRHRRASTRCRPQRADGL